MMLTRSLAALDVPSEETMVTNRLRLALELLQPADWQVFGTCQQLWDTRELHLVSLDYGGETREVGAIDVNIDQDLVA